MKASTAKTAKPTALERARSERQVAEMNNEMVTLGRSVLALTRQPCRGIMLYHLASTFNPVIAASADHHLAPIRYAIRDMAEGFGIDDAAIAAVIFSVLCCSDTRH
jgi:protein tyrosine phosphatase (PTP) superfamily phosphohydrolase (DUF442 family)